MVKQGILVCGLAALVLATCGAWAGAATLGGQPAKTKPAPTKTTPAGKKPPAPAKHNALPGEYGPMVRECKLTPEQTQQIFERIQAKKAALTEHEKQKPAKLNSLRKELREGRLKNDEAAIKKAEDAIKAVEDEGAKIEAAQEAQILSVLKPDQRILWEGYLLYQKASAQLKGAALSEEQLANVRDICDAFGKEVIASKDLFKARKDTVDKAVKAVLRQGPMPAGYTPKKAGGEEKPGPAEK